MATIVWNCKKSCIRYGSRDLVKGDEIPEALLTAMGPERVKKLKDAGKMVSGVAKGPNARDAAVDRAKELGIKFNSNLGIKKLQKLIEAEESRLDLLGKARELKLDVADDATAVEIQKAIDDAPTE